jgi:hypothetical protein
MALGAEEARAWGEQVAHGVALEHGAQAEGAEGRERHVEAIEGRAALHADPGPAGGEETLDIEGLAGRGLVTIADGGEQAAEDVAAGEIDPWCGPELEEGCLGRHEERLRGWPGRGPLLVPPVVANERRAVPCAGAREDSAGGEQITSGVTAQCAAQAHGAERRERDVQAVLRCVPLHPDQRPCGGDECFDAERLARVALVVIAEGIEDCAKRAAFRQIDPRPRAELEPGSVVGNDKLARCLGGRARRGMRIEFSRAALIGEHGKDAQL